MICHRPFIDGQYSTIVYIPNAFSKDWTEKCLTYCTSQPEYFGGEDDPLPRKQKWFHDNGEEEGGYFDPSWNKRFKRWEAHRYDDTLRDIQNTVDHATQLHMDSLGIHVPTDFNSCLINLYPDENASIKLHADSASRFGPTPTIAIASIGATRDLCFYRRDCTTENPRSRKLDSNHSKDNFSIQMEEGSLLLMAEWTQRYFFHEIPKAHSPCGARYSLTFRRWI